jgi:hypothetical protein
MSLEHIYATVVMISAISIVWLGIAWALVKPASKVANSKTASRSSKCRLTPPAVVSSRNLPHSSGPAHTGLFYERAASGPMQTSTHPASQIPWGDGRASDRFGLQHSNFGDVKCKHLTFARPSPGILPRFSLRSNWRKRIGW